MVAFSLVIFLILINLKGNFAINNSLSMLAVFGLASYKLLPNFQNIFFNLSTIVSFQESFYKIRNDLKENLTKVFEDYSKTKLPFEKNLELKNQLEL